MAMIERTKTRAADDLPACDVDLHKWQGRTRVAGSQRHVDEMAHAFGRCGRIRIPRPDRRIAADRDQRLQMQGLQRFKTDMLTAERRHLQLWKVTAHHEIPSQTFRRGNEPRPCAQMAMRTLDRKSTRLNSSH